MIRWNLHRVICKYAEIFCWKNVSSFCSAKATHIFSAKNIRILYIESAKTVNEMTLNELIKLMTLWTTWSRYLLATETLYSIQCGQQRPWSDCKDEQTDLDHDCPHMPKDMFLHGTALFIVLFFSCKESLTFSCQPLSLYGQIGSFPSFSSRLWHFMQTVS